MHKFPFKSQLHAKITAQHEDLPYSAAWGEVEASSLEPGQLGQSIFRDLALPMFICQIFVMILFFFSYLQQ